MVCMAQPNVIIISLALALNSPDFFFLYYQEWKAFPSAGKQMHLLSWYWVSKWTIMQCSISEILMDILIFWVSVFSECLNCCGVIWSIQRLASNLEWQQHFPTKEIIPRYSKHITSYLDWGHIGIRKAKQDTEYMPICRQIMWEALFPKC